MKLASGNLQTKRIVTQRATTLAGCTIGHPDPGDGFGSHWLIFLHGLAQREIGSLEAVSFSSNGQNTRRLPLVPLRDITMARVLSKSTYTSLLETLHKLPYRNRVQTLSKLFPQ